ncbi:putative entry exclusion protein TrbK-alt [Blastomonas sp. SL216]|uniref:putative entry exclusion protein TrbK-alt n=1 Tax=Blastomonas sp. SL216 TaxID=2995169 RepID=UPI00406A807D
MARTARLAAAASMAGLFAAVTMMSGVRQSPKPVASSPEADETSAPTTVTADPGRCRTLSSTDETCAAFWEERHRRFFRQDRHQP